MKKLNYFKFRAECQHDVQELMKLMDKKKVLMMSITKEIFLDINGIRFRAVPDVEVQINTTYPLETLRDIMRTIPDGHVMVQTLCNKEDYDGERNKDE